MSASLYIVSGRRSCAPDWVPHWRTSMVTNSILAARNWAGPESIITEHPEAEAWAIHATRVLPDAAITNAIAA